MLAGPSGRSQPLDDQVGQALLLEDHAGSRRSVSRVLGLDDGFFVHVAEEADLLLHVVVNVQLGAADQDVGLDADLAQLDDRVLGRLGLDLAPRADIGDQRDVDIQHVLVPDVFAQLPDGFQERQALDVADRAADLGDHHVRPGLLAQPDDALLDLVGDVRDHLHGAAQIVARAAPWR